MGGGIIVSNTYFALNVSEFFSGNASFLTGMCGRTIEIFTSSCFGFSKTELATAAPDYTAEAVRSFPLPNPDHAESYSNKRTWEMPLEKAWAASQTAELTLH